MLKLTGIATSTAFVAGCGGDGNGDNGGNGGNGGGGVEIEPDTQIEFDGQTSGWVGIAPDSIADEENPTLILQEGETYEMGWTEGDDQEHNIEIRDDSDEIVDDLATETTTEPGDDQWLEFEASSEMATYVCEVHPDAMLGDIQVEGGGGGGDGNETDGNETDGNETDGNETDGNETEDGNETG